ncbi:IGF-like family receptor 1 isoform X2 [Salarias fasciatus]|uniref:TNFR-Cys domain-containing protein n=1 Tax=Salarias fasciatus TaxID=181472 RepID=A0A672G1U0_SALFA|nr:IGF-like family receptor 1 isoform X2 [Salarias fasciatus]
MAHSVKCGGDLTTRWDKTQGRCVLCRTTPVPPGKGVTPNCGYDDDGGRHESTTSPCKGGTFNDGKSLLCRDCTRCPAGQNAARNCSLTADTVCAAPRTSSPTVPDRLSEKPQPHSIPSPHLPVIWTVSSVVVVCIVLAALGFYMRRRRGWRTAGSFNRRPSYVNAAFRNSDVEEILNAAILSAPLQTVLDNLDVLEELVILLDPESRGIKNTKHLASLCSFPSTWITYTYSMKESKSPLRAVLEGVTSRNPDWTVDHLVRLLKQMERNDAIAALAKLRVTDTNI